MHGRDAAQVAAEITALRKSGQLAAAVELGRAAWPTWGEDPRLRQAVGWCLWERIKARLDAVSRHEPWTAVLRDLHTLSTWAHAAVEAGAFAPYDPFPFTLCAVLRAAAKAKAPAKVLAASGLADPALLSPVRSRGYPSPRMVWLAHTSSALAERRDWPRLLALEARELVPAAEVKEAQWVRYRFALAHEATGDAAGALVRFDQTFQAMDAPWKRVVRARLLLSIGLAPQAVDEARRAMAATRPKELPLAGDALHVIARALATEDPERARAHAAIAAALSPGGRVSAKLRATLGALGLRSIEAASAEVRQEQGAWWKAAEVAVRQRGTVSSHLAHGRAGFIAGEDGASYYFSLRRGDDGPLLPVGAAVSFEVVESFDARKNRPSTKAVRVRRG